MPYTEDYIKHLRTQRRIFLVINVIAAVSMGILFYFIIHQQHQITRQAQTIQDERVANILRGCRSQNLRHDKTIKRLDALLKSSGVSKAKQKQSRQNTVFLIDALQPKQDCQKLVRLQVPSERETK